MPELYLITGFLGAGKTTFLKQFIPLFSGRKLQLIVNEFGREGVDGTLLAEYSALLSEITGGSVFCSCRLDQFEKVLRTEVEPDTEVILVEASGLSDPTGVRRLFARTERFPNIHYRGAVCLIDAVRFPKLYATARTCVKQLAAGDLAVVNKIDRASPEQLETVRALISGQRPDMPILETSYGRIPSDFLTRFDRLGPGEDSELPLTADLTLRKRLVTIAPTISRYTLQKYLEYFLEDTFRVKGFIRTAEGVYLADCVGNVVSLTPYEGAVPEEKLGHLVVLSGAGMPIDRRLREAAALYSDYILSMT